MFKWISYGSDTKHPAVTTTTLGKESFLSCFRVFCYNLSCLWVYSGRRGVHCLVCDSRARRLGNEQRASIADYFRVYKRWANSEVKCILKPIALSVAMTSMAATTKSMSSTTTLRHSTISITNQRAISPSPEVAVSNVSWGGAQNNSPILVYLGGESPIDYLLTKPLFLSEIAAHFNALLVYIKHRYYGESYPFGSREEAYRNSSTLGYLSSSQALADYAELIIDLKKNLSADNFPVVVASGSYAGMLASWFRLKYQHIAIGAFASSAPILYFDNIISPQHGYYDVVTKDFRVLHLS